MSETVTPPDTIAVSRAQFDLMQRSTNLLDQMLGHPTHAPAVEAVVEEGAPKVLWSCW